MPADDTSRPVDEFIVDLVRDGRVDSAGAFSLDTTVAREKLRHFLLVDPHRYVLLLVQLAHLQEATRIDFLGERPRSPPGGTARWREVGESVGCRSSGVIQIEARDGGP